MKLLELLRTLDSHTYVRINVIDVDKNKSVIIIGETSIKCWAALMKEIASVGCAEYTVTQVYCLWHAQELYIDCMKL